MNEIYENIKILLASVEIEANDTITLKLTDNSYLIFDLNTGYLCKIGTNKRSKLLNGVMYTPRFRKCYYRFKNEPNNGMTIEEMEDLYNEIKESIL